MKRIISILMCICILLSLAVSVNVVSANTATAPGNKINNGVLLYYWYGGYNGGKYTRFTDSDLKKLNNVTNEFIMIPIINVNYYVDKDGITREIISKDDINSLPLSGIEWTSEYNLTATKKEYLDLYNNMAIKKYTLNEYVDETVAFAKRLVALNPNVRLWFSVPLTSMHALSYLQGPVWNEYVIDAFKDKVGSDIWNNNIKGIYFANEDAYPGFTKFDHSDPANDFNNPIVKSMHDVSDKIHSYGKSMVWIPYCIKNSSRGWETYKRVASIANKTDIFDTVTIQPKIYFGQNTADQIGFLKESIEQNAFIDPDTGAIVGGEKTSSTKIGIEIEMDRKLASDQVYYDRFYTQFDFFKDYVGSIPFTFYAGAPDELMKIYEHIDKFLKVDNGDYWYKLGLTDAMADKMKSLKQDEDISIWDENGDGRLNKSEIGNITELNINNWDIDISFDGFENLTALSILGFGDMAADMSLIQNAIDSIPSLDSLAFENVKNLNGKPTSNGKITTLMFNGTDISGLDMSALTGLEQVLLYGDFYKSMPDTSTTDAILTLYETGIDNIKVPDYLNGLVIMSNKAVNIDFSSAASLIAFVSDETDFLSQPDFSKLSSVTYLSISNSNLEKFPDLSANKNLTEVIISGCGITNIDNLSLLSGRDIEVLFPYNNVNLADKHNKDIIESVCGNIDETNILQYVDSANIPDKSLREAIEKAAGCTFDKWDISTGFKSLLNINGGNISFVENGITDMTGITYLSGYNTFDFTGSKNIANIEALKGLYGKTIILDPAYDTDEYSELIAQLKSQENTVKFTSDASSSGSGEPAEKPENPKTGAGTVGIISAASLLSVSALGVLISKKRR